VVLDIREHVEIAVALGKSNSQCYSAAWFAHGISTVDYGQSKAPSGKADKLGLSMRFQASRISSEFVIGSPVSAPVTSVVSGYIWLTGSQHLPSGRMESFVGQQCQWRQRRHQIPTMKSACMVLNQHKIRQECPTAEIIMRNVVMSQARPTDGLNEPMLPRLDPSKQDRSSSCLVYSLSIGIISDFLGSIRVAKRSKKLQKS